MEIGDYVLVRTYSAGVFVGEMVSRNGQEVVLKNARRIWYWSGASSLSQLAVDGPQDIENCKFPCEVPEVLLTEAIEMLPISDKAKKQIAKVKIWKQ